jgi:para-aminobenzoate synthetase component 2
MILIIDNYDSFVYNLARYVRELGQDVQVIRNDGLALDWIDRYQPTHIIISPGPRTPLEAGLSNRIIQQYGSRIPILGVCLGHQCIGHVFGATIQRAAKPMHGKSDLISHDGLGIFQGLPNPLRVTRYHSLIVTSLPDCLEAIALSITTHELMALRHRTYPIIGIQFHPEAVLSVGGYHLLSRFLQVNCKMPMHLVA